MEYRLISTPQFLRLLEDESNDGIYRRLQRLFHHGYLNRLGTNPNAPLVYALARRGAEVLDVPPPKDVGERYVLHQLMVSDFRIGLTRAARPRGIAVTWRSVPTESPVKPDGFFGVQFPGLPDGQNRAFFFLEADRSTMPGERFRAKLAAYVDWRRRGGHTALLGIRNFRVLTVTRSEARLENLARVAHAVDPGVPIFWFAAEPRLATEEAIFAPVWTVPGRDDTEALCPAGWTPVTAARPQ